MSTHQQTQVTRLVDGVTFSTASIVDVPHLTLNWTTDKGFVQSTVLDPADAIDTYRALREWLASEPVVAWFERQEELRQMRLDEQQASEQSDETEGGEA